MAVAGSVAPGFAVRRACPGAERRTGLARWTGLAVPFLDRAAEGTDITAAGFSLSGRPDGPNVTRGSV